jgi:hypothetical protein
MPAWPHQQQLQPIRIDSVGLKRMLIGYFRVVSHCPNNYCIVSFRLCKIVLVFSTTIDFPDFPSLRVVSISGSFRTPILMKLVLQSTIMSLMSSSNSMPSESDSESDSDSIIEIQSETRSWSRSAAAAAPTVTATIATFYGIENYLDPESLASACQNTAETNETDAAAAAAVTQAMPCHLRATLNHDPRSGPVRGRSDIDLKQLSDTVTVTVGQTQSLLQESSSHIASRIQQSFDRLAHTLDSTLVDNLPRMPYEAMPMPFLLAVLAESDSSTELNGHSEDHDTSSMPCSLYTSFGNNSLFDINVLPIIQTYLGQSVDSGKFGHA